MKKFCVLFLVVFSFLEWDTVHAQNNLKLNDFFSDQMILQRNHKIPVWGTAQPNSKIKIVLKKETVITTSDYKGQWKAFIPKQKAGGPYELMISSKKEKILLKDILIGDVWLASGQSNMHLDLNRTYNGKEVAKRANNLKIRIYNMKPTYPTGKGGVHTLEELNKIQNNQYFNIKGWVKSTPENVLYFSAVAYYFAEKLQKELNIPIGIIHNAVPGSPIESWLSRKSIQELPEVMILIKKRWADKENEKDGMILTAKNQISQSKNKEQKHPWMPFYNYKNGIVPIKNIPVKGVIWYQGESNAEHPELYKKMFTKMVSLWRTTFPVDFPFYSVQLTSREDRGAWPAFRNAQRELLEMVPNSKMIVTTDVGDRQDTHAKNKKPVGHRLALLALGDTYKTINDYGSPFFDKIMTSKNTGSIYFKGAFKALDTTLRQDIGFEISNDHQSYRPLKVKVCKKKVEFEISKEYQSPIYIRYAWKSYVETNLKATNGLPVSPFSAEIK